MSLRERLQARQTDAQSVIVLRPESGIGHAAYQELKVRVHQKLLDRVNLSVMESLTPERLKEEIALLVERLLTDEAVVVNEAERASLIRDIQNEMLGLGPLEPLLADPTISDILVNGHSQVYVERRG